MNFLLHRHFAAAELGSDAAGIGAMLPDLWRMADRRVRPLPLGPPGAPGASPSFEVGPLDDSAYLPEILAGIEHHLEIDQWFHATPELVLGERFTIERLRVAGLAALRLGRFAHIAWEMALDGALVEKTGLPQMLDDLRASFAATSRARRAAAGLHHFARVARPPEEREAFELRMIRLADEIAKGPWIDSYRSGAGLAICLAGVRARVGLPPLDDDARRLLAGALDPVVNEARRALDALLARRASVREGALAVASSDVTT